MVHTLSRRALIAFGLLVSALAVPLPALAGDPQIDAAKAAGIVGERIDGLLGLVTDTDDAALVRRVNEINNLRQAAYSRLAAETGASIADIARITGEKQIANAMPGHYYMDASGTWKRK